MENITRWHIVRKYYASYTPPVPAYKCFYNAHYRIPNISQKRTTINIYKADTLDVAKTLHNPLVLILADAHYPGGCVEAGAGMQEESIFRRTALYKHISKDFYPIEDDAAIYIPRVQLYKDGNLDFIACPGIKLPQLKNNKLMDEDAKLLEKKIELILQIAHIHNHTTIVLGALGCGVWGCPPIHVAEIFKNILGKYDGIFENVSFAILGSTYNFFSSVFEENTK
jgi:uncharacterized protein (TIGR02452 family)